MKPLLLSASAVMVAANTSPALAQADAAPEQLKWVAVIVATALTACIVLVSVMRSKRSHRD